MSSTTGKTAVKKYSIVDIHKPLFKGHMYKQGHGHKSFNKRYFALYPKVMVYYDHEQDYLRDLERGTLEHRDKGFHLESMYLTKPEKKPHGAKFCFILHCPHALNERKEILLVTETRDLRRKWMDKLQEQNPALLHHEHHHHEQKTATLEVPKARIRADSSVGLYQDDESQNLDIHEGSSDTES